MSDKLKHESNWFHVSTMSRPRRTLQPQYNLANKLLSNSFPLKSLNRNLQRDYKHSSIQTGEKSSEAMILPLDFKSAVQCMILFIYQIPQGRKT